MTVKTLERKINNMSSELARMRSLFISVIGQDNEGEYRPEFVEEILKIADQKQSGVEFTSAGDFLNQIR